MTRALVLLCVVLAMGCGPGRSASVAGAPATARDVDVVDETPPIAAETSDPVEVAEPVVVPEPEVEASPEPASDAVPLAEETEVATGAPVDVHVEAEPTPEGAEDPAAGARLAALRRRGRVAYERHCESCHDEGPRLLGRDLAATAIRRQVRAGGRRMRAIPPERLSERDLQAICALLARS